MTTNLLAADFASWAIVRTDGGYEARKVPLDRIGAPDVIAIHPSEASARAGLMRVRIVDGLPMPRWRGAVSHERALRETIARVIREVALPGPGTEPGGRLME